MAPVCSEQPVARMSSGFVFLRAGNHGNDMSPGTHISSWAVVKVCTETAERIRALVSARRFKLQHFVK